MTFSRSRHKRFGDLTLADVEQAGSDRFYRLEAVENARQEAFDAWRDELQEIEDRQRERDDER